MTGRGPWNHNIYYGRQLLVPDSARDALDVGYVEGWMVRELRRRVGRVVGIEVDGDSTAARAHGDVDGFEYLQGDLLTHPFERESFDVVTVVASLDHLDEESGLRRMADLLRPGGTLGVIGLARSRSPPDFTFDLGGVVTKQGLDLATPLVEQRSAVDQDERR